MTEAAAPHDELLGATIAGRYWIISRLGAGGMGVAYRAWDESGSVPVVIKIPKRAFLEDPKFTERFYREIRLLQGLAHPHVVPIVDVGEHDRVPYIVLRFLPGGSLSNRRLRDKQGSPTANPAGMLHLWLPAVAAALDHVHAQGVVHRDVKPANIFFDAFWGAYLGDFGIAKIVEESDAFDREQTLTATHMGIGTPEYMSPEQFTPKAVIDGRADQYALAVTVYDMLAGHKPFMGKKAHLIVEVTTQAPPPLEAKRPDLPASLVAAVSKGLAKKPASRFESCAAFAAAVLQNVPVLEDEPGVARLLCPHCSNILKLPVAAAGQNGKCPRCRSKMKVAEDLGALWLLEEDRAQNQPGHEAVVPPAVPLAVPGESLPGDDASSDGGGLPEFKPVSSTTPIGRSIRKRRRISPLAILCCVAAAVALGGFLWPEVNREVEKLKDTLRQIGTDARDRRQKSTERAAVDETDRVQPPVDERSPPEVVQAAPEPVAQEGSSERPTAAAVATALPDDAIRRELSDALPSDARPLLSETIGVATVATVATVAPAAPPASADGGEPTDGPLDRALQAHDQAATDDLGKEPEPAPPPSLPRTERGKAKAGALSCRFNAAEIAKASGGGADTEQAVDRALKWLAIHQLPDGAWSFDLAECPECNGRCANSGESHKADRCAATAMAMLPFLGRGYTHRDGPYKKTIDKGMGFLASQALSGRGKLYANRGSLYSQGIATLALCECYALTYDRRLQMPAQLAINYIMDAQDPRGGGWRYQPKQPGDTSASGWQLMALKAGTLASLQVNPLTIKNAVRFLDAVQSEDGAAYGYTDPGRASGTTAVGLLCRMNLGWKKDHPALQQGVASLAKQGPSKDLYFNYYATQILRHFEGDMWIAWNHKMKGRLLTSQSRQGHAAGSFYDGVDGGHGAQAAGRLYCTSLATLILETYYRYPSMYRARAADEPFKE